MSGQTIAGLIMFCASMSCCFAANMIWMMMIGEINRRKDDANQVSYFGVTPGKWMFVFREYKRLYPAGRLGFYFKLLTGCFVALLLIVGRMIGLLL